ncbi:hypothetical protein NDU88_001913 [Pleurodeles waltl]|uniref:Uncharacterized protein n=1 Tax=Pleurodeles waltl TaxID=8319 RepID=A0AAV7TLQ3_PLEWA|nr:hypothetical protein NDU88_001913 [Pleurodeles waltl]
MGGSLNHQTDNPGGNWTNWLLRKESPGKATSAPCLRCRFLAVFFSKTGQDPRQGATRLCLQQSGKTAKETLGEAPALMQLGTPGSASLATLPDFTFSSGASAFLQQARLQLLLRAGFRYEFQR